MCRAEMLSLTGERCRKILYGILLVLILFFMVGAQPVAPVVPDPSPEVRAVLDFLYDMYGEKILSSQMWAPWGIDEIETVHEITGKYPALRGQDFIHESDNPNEVRLAREWWEQGGIPTIMWHWGAPSVGEGYEQSKTEIDISRCFQEGTQEYQDMWSDLERIADHLETLRDDGVPVLWRPMHEYDGGWFWYGMGSGEQFSRLWRTMFDYFTYDRELNNLIWVLPHCGNPYSGDWDPGKEYYDLAGADSYGSGVQGGMYNELINIHGEEIPKPYHECGTVPNPDECESEGVMWSWWMLWHTGHLTDHSESDLSYAYNHDLVITLDEMPDIMEEYGEGGVSGYSLSVAAIGSGSIDISPQRDRYDENESVTITAEPDENTGFLGWSGDLTGNENPVEVTMDASKEIYADFVDSSGNLLANSDFSEGGDSWTFYEYSEEGSGTASFTEGYAEIGIQDPGNEMWNVQLYQEGITLNHSVEYTLSVSMRADSERDVFIAVRHNESPYTVYYGDTVSVSDSWERYDVSFVMEEPSDQDARFELNLGAEDAGIAFDDAVLKVYEPTGISSKFSNRSNREPSGIKGTFYTANSLCIRYDLLNSQGGELRIVDMKGGVVARKSGLETGESVYRLDRGLFSGGVYFVLLNTGERVYSKKFVVFR